MSGIFGLITYIRGRDLGLLDVESGVIGVTRSRTASFLYLEVLDASFSFDRVIGAFALSNNLFIIVIGLGVGAIFVRSLTILLAEEETLASYRYLEHGAFYAIIALAFAMFVNTIEHIPEALIGSSARGSSSWPSSILYATTVADRAADTRKAKGALPL